MRYEAYIALRHLVSRKGRSLSLVSLLAVMGVAIGVSALIGGLSITAGFEESFRDKLLGVTAHVFARPQSSIRYDAQEIETFMKARVPEVIAVSPTTYHKTILSGPGGTTGGFIKSLIPDSAERALKLPQYLKSGSLQDLRAQEVPTPMIIGAQLAHRLKVDRGDILTALSTAKSRPGRPQQWSTRTDAPSTFTFKVVGVFQAGYDEYDARFAYIHLEDAERLFGMTDNVRGFEIAVRDPALAFESVPHIESALRWGLGGPLDWGESLALDPARAGRIATRAEEGFQVQDWYAQNPTLYVSLLYQRIAILVVLSVMLILAACNVASMLIMMTLERTKDIAILKAMGATEESIKRIFLFEGIGIAFIGSLLGAVLGLFFTEVILGQGITLDPKVYGIDHFPIRTRLIDYVYALMGSLLIIGIAVSFPARRGSRLKPTDGLREDQLDSA
jgi:lipoprotein-releasing system permease protein